MKFDPELVVSCILSYVILNFQLFEFTYICFKVHAVDPDKTSVISYSILEGPNSELFSVDSVTGKIGIQGNFGLDMTHVKEDRVTLIVQVRKIIENNKLLSLFFNGIIYNLFLGK